MDALCQTCDNTDCKERGEKFMGEKLPGCKYLAEHPELFEDQEEYT